MELVVSISVLLVLAGITLGVTKTITDTSRQTRCLSNLKQWAVAIHRYADDHQGRFPLSHPFDDGKAWYHFSSPLVQKYFLNDNMDPGTISRWNRGEEVNGCLQHTDRYASYAYSFHLGHVNAVGASRFRGNRVLIQRPAHFLMIVDARVSPAASGFSNATPERIGKCHTQRFNALYVDGHVESRREIDPIEFFPE